MSALTLNGNVNVPVRVMVRDREALVAFHRTRVGEYPDVNALIDTIVMQAFAYQRDDIGGSDGWADLPRDVIWVVSDDFLRDDIELDGLDLTDAEIAALDEPEASS